MTCKKSKKLSDSYFMVVIFNNYKRIALTYATILTHGNHLTLLWLHLKRIWLYR